ncbi:phosphoenolpyruvate carboxykinase [Candidatus Woesearchaeota archaeon CG08_land_8_20_14_0_20_47_9]|nr:MAG: phosphoenolpyruvate carboxykinase [Candidatus Woesearchaeota archaeon CG10_big_fil_rev_8_21_14_0_10_47_5]PIO03967.1 MAG: phosphoenolpyruvate carboxykinase [Candidatus Woesearchaeota archaeon CG08_land_8_20_14_0_20_47_9]
MQKSEFYFHEKQVIVKSRGRICQNPEELTQTEIFRTVVARYLEFLKGKDSYLLGVFPPDMTEDGREGAIIRLLSLLTRYTKDTIIRNHPELKGFFADTYTLNQFVENLYNYWRSFERFFVYYSDSELKDPPHLKPYLAFNETVEHLNRLVRQTYREVCENITLDHPRIYRQLPAGFQVGLIVAEEDWQVPGGPYSILSCIPFIKRVLITPPLIIDPPMNKRDGQFEKVASNPLDEVRINTDEWLCYPAKVGELVIFFFFHNRHIGLGTALANLFELARDEELKRKPDAIYVYGVDEEALRGFNSKTVFFDDEENNLFVAAVPGKDIFSYFGYVKKMILTLHNSIMMKRGRLPVHGAMVSISLKNGKSANIILLGDTGTGKSESLEAFRVIGDSHIRDMTIVFDDMGSLEISENSRIMAYGTETGAFVRLDDLQPGFAFGNIDRSIIMSPQKVNARAVLPITTLKNVLQGYPVDFLLYANNYEEVDEAHPFFEEFCSADEAIKVFREGARMAKGTTTEKGLVHAYFANIFGPHQYRELHEKLAEKFFEAFFSSGVRVGQLRTRLGIPGLEKRGPESAAKALLEVVSRE